jgi:HEAT repeat protein
LRPRMVSFKTDESFLSKVSMGAIGTQKVLAQLAFDGHRPIELERFSSNFKIWKSIKIKRIRVPDALCLACATRVESRAKKSFEISMSHSISDPDRGWDTGLADNDWIAIVVCAKNGERPVDWQALDPVQFIHVGDMRRAAAAKLAQVQKPKGAGEAFETRIVWPSAAASAAGTVIVASGERIQVRRAVDNQLLTVALRRKQATLLPLVSEGVKVVPRQALAAVVPVATSIPCPADATAATYLSRLNSTALSDRYTAVKALRHFEEAPARDALRSRAADGSEHVYVRLEAASGLARWNEDIGWSIIDNCLSSNYLQERLEAVIVLAEIGGEKSQQRLQTVLRDDTQHPEIRAGAAWGLGELRTPTVLDALIATFEATDPLLRVEAARALARVALLYPSNVVAALPNAAETSRPGVAWALSQSGTFDVDQLFANLNDVDTRHWVAYVVGTQEPSRLIEHVEQLRARDAELYFAVTLLWKLTTSWIYQLEMY